MSELLNMITIALYAALLQNVVLCGAYGITEAMRVAAKPQRIVRMSLFVLFFSVAGNAAAAALNLVPEIRSANNTVHLVLYTGVIFVLYFITVLVFKVGFKSTHSFLRQIGAAAFNTLVIPLPLLSYRAAYTITESIGAGIGTGVAFFVATVLLSFGMSRIAQSRRMPASFRGIPALLLYTALLSLAFMGFSGESLIV